MMLMNLSTKLLNLWLFGHGFRPFGEIFMALQWNLKTFHLQQEEIKWIVMISIKGYPYIVKFITPMSEVQGEYGYEHHQLIVKFTA